MAPNVELQVRRTDEVRPALPGVTALSPVYDFGPDGTVFAEGVSVSFALTSPGAGLPLIFWTQADGTFAPLPSGKLLTDGQVFISNGMDVRLTAVRPRDEARAFTGPVFDLTMSPFMTGDVHVEVAGRMPEEEHQEPAVRQHRPPDHVRPVADRRR